jgi:CRP/FNR family transcriptional regulator, cyclic AMP receptor protein
VNDLIPILRQVEIFHGMSHAQLSKIAAIAQEQQYSPDTIVFNQGEEGDAMYIISQGQVEVRVTQTNGDHNAAVYLGTGQTVGEMSLVDQGRRSATIVTIDDATTLYRISTEDFTKLCKTETSIGYVLMRNIAQDLSFKLRHRDFDGSKS